MWEMNDYISSKFLNSNDYEARHWNKEHTSYKDKSNLVVSDLTLVNLPCKSNFILSCNNTRENSGVILLAD